MTARGPTACGAATGHRALARRPLPLRGRGLRASRGRSGDQRGDRPVLARRWRRTPRGRSWSNLRRPRAQAPRLGPAAQAAARASRRTPRSTSCTCGTSPSPTPTVPAAHRGTYLAFTDRDSAGMRHLRGARRGRAEHAAPAADLRHRHASRSGRVGQQEPACDLASLPARLRPQQQACVDGGARTPTASTGGTTRCTTPCPRARYATEPGRRRRAPASSGRWSQGSTAPACGW